MIVSVQNLSKSFGRVRAVDNVSFNLGAGQIFGFVGPNGAGKTTTMRILATLEEQDSGDVFFDSFSITEDPEAARRSIGYVPDTLPAHRDITVFEFLDFFGRAYGMRGRKLRSAIDDVVDFAGLSEMMDKTLASLSKGMKQRVSVGRALIHNPPVIEKGRILVNGSVNDILDQSRSRRKLSVSAAENNSFLKHELLSCPGVLDARIEGNKVVASIEGDDKIQAQILNQLVSKGCPVCQFYTEDTDLEDIFMEITKGEVQ